MASAIPACYHVDHAAAVEEVDALAALLAGVIQSTHGRAFFTCRLEDIAESARQYESVRRQLELLGELSDVEYLTR